MVSYPVTLVLDVKFIGDGRADVIAVLGCGCAVGLYVPVARLVKARGKLTCPGKFRCPNPHRTTKLS